MAYRDPDQERALADEERALKEQADLERFARDLQRRPASGLSEAGPRLVRLPSVFWFFVFATVGGAIGCGGVYVLNPAHGDGMAQLGTLLEAMFFGFLGILLGLVGFVAARRWRKRRFGF